MKLPFSTAQFFDVFKQYNQAVWPAQIVLNILAVFILILIFYKFQYSDKMIAAGLALLWGWTAIVYHFMYFSKINPASKIFGTLVLIQAVLFIVFGVAQSKLVFQAALNVKTIIGLTLILYALVIYPCLGFATGHKYPYSPTFGAPCPTTIFTIGMFFLLIKPFPKTLLIIPILWSIVGGSAAIVLQVREDFGLIVAGILAFLLALGF